MPDADAPHDVVAAARDVARPGMTGKITSAVVEAYVSYIPAASVAITNIDKLKVVRTLATDHYDAPLLQVGTYSVSVTASGFAPKSVDHIQVEVSAALKINIAWQPHYLTGITKPKHEIY